MEHTAKIFVDDHRKMVGRAIVRPLQSGGSTNLLKGTHSELDLLGQRWVHELKVTLHQRSFVIMKLEQALALAPNIVTLQHSTPGGAFARIAGSRAQPL